MSIFRPIRNIRTVSGLGAAQKNARARLVLLGFCVLVPFAVIAMRVVDLSVLSSVPRGDVRSEAVVAASKGVVAKKKQQWDGMRADIIDREGELLATSLLSKSLYADPSLIDDAESVAEDLSVIFTSMARGQIQKKLEQSGRFVWLKRGVTPKQAQRVNDLGYPGLAFKSEYRRFYPKEELVSHLLGYTNIDGSGLAGIERSYDDRLKYNADPVMLTIDVRIQNIVRQALLKAVREFDAQAAAGMVLDIKTGEILAAVSLPDFDPHHPGKASSDQLFNRFMQGNYELGSTFKLFSVAAYLDSVDDDLSQQFDATTPLRSGKFTISDYHAQNRLMNVPEVFMHSSNIGVALMADKMGSDAFQDAYKRFGFFDRLNVDFSEKSDPLLPKIWRAVNSLTASFGHGIAVSPMHVARAAAAIMNDGMMADLRLVQDDKPSAIVVKRVVDEETATKMRQLMRLTVQSGTGGKADVEGYSVGGKTGTAEKPGKGGYDSDRLLSSFLAAYPMTDPRYLVYVLVDEPQPNSDSHGYATGGWVAAPAVKSIIQGMNRILIVSPVPAHKDAAFMQPVMQVME